MQKLEERIQEINRFKVEYQGLKETLATEFKSLRTEIEATLEALQKWKGEENAKSEKFKEGVAMSLRATYTRWERTTCPQNGSEPVYKGYAGGSSHAHKGAAVSMLCLPENPDWDSGKYADKLDPVIGYIYGTEYQDAQERNDQLFGESHYNNDVPCVVCEVRMKQNILIIPGKSKCPAGWSVEYSGFLMTGHYNHPAATDYYCVDGEPENIPGGEASHDGYLLYFVEARCGSLACPPYINGRELQCVVCSK